MKTFYLVLVCNLSILSSVVAHQEIRKQLDKALDLRRNGKIISREVQMECNDAFKRYTDELFAKHKVEVNFKLPEPHTTHYYVNAACAGLVCPSQHGGWVTRSDISIVVRQNLITEHKKALEAKDDTYDPMRVYAYLVPSCLLKDSKQAMEAFEWLIKRDLFLAKQAIYYSYDAKIQMSAIESFYRKAGEDKKADHVRKLFHEILFPKGVDKLSLADFDAPPTGGMLIVGTPNPVKGINTGDIVVAVNGVYAPSDIAYQVQRDSDINNPRMNLIIWRDGKYLELKTESPGRKLGVQTLTYDSESIAQIP